MNIQILSHVPFDSIYGAGSSLRNHYIAMEPYRDFIFRHISRTPSKSFLRRPLSIDKRCNIVSNFNSSLPIDFNWDGANAMKFKGLRKFVAGGLFWAHKGRTLESIKSGNPDLIHINSLALVPVLKSIVEVMPQVKIVAHVRELLSFGLSSNQISDLDLVDGFISIDKAAQDRLIKVAPFVSKKISAIIQNPFRPVNNIFKPNCDSTVFHNKIKIGMAGQISEDKGVLFVMESLLASNCRGFHLILAGESKGEYGRKVLALCSTHAEYFTYIGEIPNLNESGFYNFIDIVARGDDSFRTGRTVFEALFSGKCCILPGTQEDVKLDQNLARFFDKLYTFNPNNVSSLAETFKRIYNNFPTIISPIVEDGNFPDYAFAVNNFYCNVLQT